MIFACSSGLRPGLLSPSMTPVACSSMRTPLPSSLSLMRTRATAATTSPALLHEPVGEDGRRGADAGARLERGVALLPQDDLDGAEHRHDVELVVVAEVRDAEDLALHRVLAARDREVGAVHEALVDG